MPRPKSAAVERRSVVQFYRWVALFAWPSVLGSTHLTADLSPSDLSDLSACSCVNTCEHMWTLSFFKSHIAVSSWNSERNLSPNLTFRFLGAPCCAVFQDRLGQCYCCVQRLEELVIRFRFWHRSDDFVQENSNGSTVQKVFVRTEKIWKDLNQTWTGADWSWTRLTGRWHADGFQPRTEMTDGKCTAAAARRWVPCAQLA